MSAMNKIGLGGALVLGSAASISPAYGAETLAGAFREGDVIVDLRARYESVEQDGFTSEADALTNRLRAGFQTAPLKGTAFLAEGVVVDDLVDDYNSTTNGQTEYPVVADPDDIAAINRFAVINKSLERTTVTFGRQRIVHDDQRFVGNVGWRQNEQTFDALRAQWGSTKIKTDLTYASQVNRVFGPDSPQGKWEGDVVLANFAYTLPDRHVGVVRLLPRHRRRRHGVEQHRRREARGLEAHRQADGHLRARVRAAGRGRLERGGPRHRLRARRRRAQLREVRRCPRATRLSAATERSDLRRRWPRCTRSKGGPTSFSRRRLQASTTSTCGSAIRSGSAGRSRASQRSPCFTTTTRISAARTSARS